MAGGVVRGAGGDVPVTRWTYDSRLPAAAEGNCFLALGTGRRNGFAYVDDLLGRGVRLFCVSARDAVRLSPKQLTRGTFWIVGGVLASVQTLAAEHRNGLRGEVVAITGSNGKTIVKEWLYRLLTAVGFRIYRSPASHNSQLGVALSVLHDRDEATEVHVFEAGVSRAGEMASLERMLRPTFGILTNLGSAHDAGFGSRREKLVDKLVLFYGAEAIVYGADDAFVHTQVSNWIAGLPPENFAVQAAWGEHVDAPDVDAPDVDAVTFVNGEVVFRLVVGVDGPLVFRLPCPFADAASRQNLAHALLSVIRIGLRAGRLTSASAHVFSQRLRATVPTLAGLEMRLQVYEGRWGTRIIDDSYTADEDGLRAATEFFGQQRIPDAPASWILGPLDEGEISVAQTAALFTELARRHGVDTVTTIGEALNGISLPGIKHHHHPTAEKLLREMGASDAHDLLTFDIHEPSTILVKGPRALRFDRIAGSLRKHAHGLRLEISLSAIAHNVAAYRARLRPETMICVMVKAEAYGSGGPEVAAFLEARGVDYLAVATVDEGVAIREAGVALPIIVANSVIADQPRMLENRLEPEITGFDQLSGYWAAQRTAAGSRRPLPIHLKFDTGMRRLGFDATATESRGLERVIDVASDMSVASVFSHLSAADRADDEADAYTHLQHDRLLEVHRRLARASGTRPFVHLLNSAGAWRFPAMQHDMVRLGIGVYGVGLEDIAPGALEPAHRWVAQIVQIRDVPAGDIVGYGLGGRADHDRRIGVVNVGYADGLRRAAGNGRFSLVVDGRLAPTVGNVCMDFTMVDLAGVPHAAVGDEAVVFGPEQPVQVLAKAYDTIAYEVFTGIGSRVRRVFYR